MTMSPAQYQQLRTRQQQARQERAETQEFIFWPTKREGIDNCLSTGSGKHYLVSATDCTCRDQAGFGARRLRLVCKHRIAREIWLRTASR